MSDGDDFDLNAILPENPDDVEATGPACRLNGYPKIAMYSSDELRGMSAPELISHTVRLQQLYSQLESDNSFLNWEFEELKNNFTYFSRAAKLAHQLNAADVDTIASLAVEELPTYFDCDFAALYFYDADGGFLHLYRSNRPSPNDGHLYRDADSAHFLVRLLFGHAEPFIAEYDTSESLIVSDNEEKIRTKAPDDWLAILGKKILVLPLQIKATDKNPVLHLGGLILGGAKKNLEPADAEVSSIFADLFSSSLYNARLVRKLNDMAIIDPLTQIYNRRHLIMQMNMAIAQAKRHGHEVSIAMLDIDNFKRYNDTYGHLCGDAVLREMAELVQNSIRINVDVLARFGGEEFIVLMPYTGLEQASRVAERIREIIKEHAFIAEGHKLSVTCSIGLAEYIVDETLERFIDRADAALYQAKRTGRDRVCATYSLHDSH